LIGVPTRLCGYALLQRSAVRQTNIGSHAVQAQDILLIDMNALFVFAPGAPKSRPWYSILQ